MDMRRAPADELASVRAKIAALRARESALEAAFLEMNDTGLFPGFENMVRVERNSHSVFDISKLPDAILDDPRYYATRVVTRIHIEPRDTTGPFKLYRDRDWAADRFNSDASEDVIDHEDVFAAG